MGFEDITVHIRLKLFALCSSAMFFYIYGDYFQLWQPGHLKGMLAGQLFFPGNPQWVLLGGSSVMIVPSLMPFLALVLPVRLDRWLNIIFGVVYSLIMLAVIVASKGRWYFYTMFALIEIILTLLIVWYAWTWPKEATTGSTIRCATDWITVDLSSSMHRRNHQQSGSTFVLFPNVGKRHVCPRLPRLCRFCTVLSVAVSS